MKVILLCDVKKVGKKGQTVEVSDGYALNFLFPKKWAVKLTETSLNILNQQKEDARIEKENQLKKAQEICEKLKGITLEFTLKSNNGKTFGSISSKQIQEQLKTKHNLDIDKKKIISKDTINQLGYTKVQIDLFKGVVGEINIHVVEE